MTIDTQNNAHDRAIEALTVLARSTTSGGHRRDFAGQLADITAAVAANVGGLEILLPDRPRAWEAALVRQLVARTVPEDDLLTRRTEPIRLTLDLDDRWMDLGMESLYRADVDEIHCAQTELKPGSAEWQKLENEANAITTLYRSDRTAYVASWTTEARRTATEIGITADLDVTITNQRHSPNATDRDDPIAVHPLATT